MSVAGSESPASSDAPAADESATPDVPTGGSSRKRRTDADEDNAGAKEPRLSAREAMQLRLLASVPALSGPLRDARGRVHGGAPRAEGLRAGRRGPA